MRIMGDETSGNCLKVRYLADHLGLAYAWQPVSALGGETRQPDFLAINPMGQIPAVVFDDGRTLAQSNAILRYLAAGSTLLPDGAFAQAKVDEWLFWEQYSHEPYIAVCRFQMHYLGRAASEREPWRVERGEAALDLMDRHLASHSWFANDTFSIADIALLAYTRLAHEGGFSLTERDNVRGWISRSEGQLQLEPAAAGLQ
jgi:glutathione S-transferase